MMGSRILAVLAILAAIVAAPILLRRDTELGRAATADERLVIITPHNETIRAEFGEAFGAWWRERTGRSIYVDWRTPGGSSEIRRVLDSGFSAADADGRAGIGIDVFFGGGDYEFRKQAEAGRLVPLRVFDSHPQWFAPEVIPPQFTGELYYDPDHTWVGVCVSQFGICYNLDGLARRGLPEPRRWADLADPRYRGAIALADPTKSGSVARAFEMIVQQQMQEALAEPGRPRAEALADGWQRGMRLLQAICANARYFTDSAPKVPQDVAQGDSIAGMSIDFYSRAYHEKLKRPDGSSRLVWIAPEGGTSVSVDPVAVFRGAPHPDTAQAFAQFLLEDRGQLLWNLLPGSPGGPRSRALRRLPVRRDLYTPHHLQHFADPAAMPYERTGGFAYQPELTGNLYLALRTIIRAMCIDSHHELTAAWHAIHDSRRHTLAREALFDVSAVSHQRVTSEIAPLLKRADPLAVVRFSAALCQTFRDNYRTALTLATARQPAPSAP